MYTLIFFREILQKFGVLSIYAIPRRLEFLMRVGGCITLHTPRSPTFRSVEYAVGNRRGKSEASGRLRVRTKNASHRPGQVPAWKKSFRRERDALERGSAPLRSHLTLSPTIITKFAVSVSRSYLKNIVLFPGFYANSLLFSYRNKY